MASPEQCPPPQDSVANATLRCAMFCGTGRMAELQRLAAEVRGKLQSTVHRPVFRDLTLSDSHVELDENSLLWHALPRLLGVRCSWPWQGGVGWNWGVDETHCHSRHC